ncbi:MAG: hypothetical protein K2J71_04690 [Oscillospiraceae bacterium]|nr:hypothetical protein [Oscillospiraceae bacterium]
MSWTETIWSQDDTINNGYPFITDPGIAEKYNYTSVKSIWIIQENENGGYPVIANSGIAEKYDYTSVKSIWKFKNNVNFEFPYIIDMAEEKPDAPVFRSFSMSGLNAGFRQTNSSFMLNTSENAVFHFPERKSIIFNFRIADTELILTK